MRYVVVMRHGQYDGITNSLQDSGREVIREMVRRATEKIGINSRGQLVVWASDELRAVESALTAIHWWREARQINVHRLETKRGSWKTRIEEIGGMDFAKVLFWFAHLEQVERFSLELLGEKGVYVSDNHYGTTLIIDLQEKTVEVLQPDSEGEHA